MHQLFFAFLQVNRHIAKAKFGLGANALKSEPVTLREIDPTKNMSRFYSLEVERDLLGNIVLVRRWGRIGSAGKVRMDQHNGEGEAFAALQTLQEAKRRKGYQSIPRA